MPPPIPHMMRRCTSRQADFPQRWSANSGMDGDELVDEKAIVARIRERLRNDVLQSVLRASHPRQDAPTDHTPEAIHAELETMCAAADIGNVSLKSYRRFVGPVLSLARRIARRIMAGVIEQQVAYNLANHRLALALREQLDALRAEQEALRRRYDAQEARLARMERETDGG
jgi:hypothetical protein